MYKRSTSIAAAVIISGIFFTIYGVGQQILRQTANDPQIMIAQEVAAKLDGGATPSTALGSTVHAINFSSLPFTGIYQNGTLVATGGLYYGKKLSIPAGVYEHMGDVPYHAITWQAEPDLRLASISVHSKRYSIVTARSLKDTEDRIGMVAVMVIIGWLGSLGVLTAALIWNQRSN